MAYCCRGKILSGQRKNLCLNWFYSNIVVHCLRGRVQGPQHTWNDPMHVIAGRRLLATQDNRKRNGATQYVRIRGSELWNVL